MYRYKVGIQVNCTKYYIIKSDEPLDDGEVVEKALEKDGDLEVPDDIHYHNDTQTEVEEIK